MGSWGTFCSYLRPLLYRTFVQPSLFRCPPCPAGVLWDSLAPWPQPQNSALLTSTKTFWRLQPYHPSPGSDNHSSSDTIVSSGWSFSLPPSGKLPVWGGWVGKTGSDGKYLPFQIFLSYAWISVFETPKPKDLTLLFPLNKVTILPKAMDISKVFNREGTQIKNHWGESTLVNKYYSSMLLLHLML